MRRVPHHIRGEANLDQPRLRSGIANPAGIACAMQGTVHCRLLFFVPLLMAIAVGCNGTGGRSPLARAVYDDESTVELFADDGTKTDADPAQTNNRGLAAQDNPTRSLIERELADASEQERTRLTEHLLRLEPDEVRSYLRLRRELRNADGDSIAASGSNSDASDFETEARQVSQLGNRQSIKSAETDTHRRPVEGLGHSNPWDPTESIAVADYGRTPPSSPGGSAINVSDSSSRTKSSNPFEPDDLQPTGRNPTGLGDGAFGHSGLKLNPVTAPVPAGSEDRPEAPGPPISDGSTGHSLNVQSQSPANPDSGMSRPKLSFEPIDPSIAQLADTPSPLARDFGPPQPPVRTAASSSRNPFDFEANDPPSSNLKIETTNTTDKSADSARPAFNPFEFVDEPTAVAAKSDEPVSPLRERFSKLGARLGLGNSDAAEPAVPQPQAQTPKVETTPAAEEPTLAALIRLTEAELTDSGAEIPQTPAQRDAWIRRHVELRMLYLLDGQQERALDVIPGIEPAEQEFWQQTLWALSQYFDVEGIPDRTERITQALSQLRTAVQRLQEEARLEIRNVNFCRRIVSFGSYERFSRDEFTPGQPVLVYAEIDNFKSEPTPDGRFRTLLRSTIEILADGPGETVLDSVEFPSTEDFCSNPRRDYFHSYEFTIPQRIKSGPHVLRLTIVDQLTGKQSRTTTNFSVR